HEVDPGAPGEDGKRTARPDEARGDLVDGAFSAHGDTETCAAWGRLSGELLQMPRAFREQDVPGEAQRLRPVGELRPAAAGRPVRRGGVDQEDGALAAQCFSSVTVTSASSVIWSTAARRSSSVMRLNSPSTTTSLTVSRQPAWIFFRAPSVKSIAASSSTARMPRSDQRWYCPPSGL